MLLYATRMAISIPCISPLTRVKVHPSYGETMHSYDTRQKTQPSPLLSREEEHVKKSQSMGFHFHSAHNTHAKHRYPLLKHELSMYEHGVNADNLDFIAET
uniref:Uncharacterized protein n=1 Tax=Lygus hesperus TaxID=30085 RepID=A0A146L822_LYGHE